MGRCRRCGCTEYNCDFWQYCGNFFQKTTDVIATAGNKFFGGNQQPNQNLAYRNCTCGHQRNYHF